ncbi:hypothetical protein BFS14_01405 [Serratia fonticola]|uniref:immunity 22 family protein n=1 Tax=Serratia TaxID=613 RepID=UPI0008FD3E75|nr:MULTISPECIES: immunity 22 family protein [Serratia]OIX96147.1 hypothetical protein BFS14_01405 [Serratia fonticola]QCR60929.1 hypothetical protein FD644_11370 [Serratia fonticola]UAN59708.1 immunity 22 family protein [Serratia sp. JSRIV004]
MENNRKSYPVSIWIGIADENFDEYIDQDSYGEACGFCKDIGQTYDVDTFSVYVSEGVVDLMDLIVEIPFSESYEDALIAKCNEIGLVKVNSYISILNEEFDFPDDKKDFSGLKFIGTFQYYLPDAWSKGGII